MNLNKDTNIIVTLILLTLSIPLFWACVNYDSYYVDEGGEGFVLHVSLSVNVQGNNSAATRADVPNGGEEGDGWRYGLQNENKLHNFTVFVLDNNNDVNSPGSTFFLGSRYFSDEEVSDANLTRGSQTFTHVEGQTNSADYLVIHQANYKDAQSNGLYFIKQ